MKELKERRKPKRSSTDSTNRNHKPRTEQTTPEIQVNGRRTSTELEEKDREEEEEEEKEGEEEDLDPEQDNNNKEEKVEEQTDRVKSNFHETFAKFKKSYLSSRAGAPVRPGPVSATVAGTALKLKINRSSPFQNLMKLSGNILVKEEPVEEPVLRAEEQVSQVEEPVIRVKTEPAEEDPNLIQNFTKPEVSRVFKVCKRKHPEEEIPPEFPAKKRPKLEKYIVAKIDTKAEKYFADLSEEEDDEQESSPVKRSPGRPPKDRCRKEHKNCRKHKDRTHAKKYKSKHKDHGSSTHSDQLDDLKQHSYKHSHQQPKETHRKQKEKLLEKYIAESCVKQEAVTVKEEYFSDTEYSERRAHKEHKKEKKRDKDKKKKKKKEKEKKLKRVKVREIAEDDYISEIMDRTPTPSSDKFTKHRTATPSVESFVKREIKEEPVEEEWETVEGTVNQLNFADFKIFFVR